MVPATKREFLIQEIRGVRHLNALKLNARSVGLLLRAEGKLGCRGDAGGLRPADQQRKRRRPESAR